MREWVYPPVIRAALTLFRVLRVRFDLRGLDNVPESGGAVLASNHVSYLDFMFVGLSAHKGRRRLVRFMAKQAVFDHRISGPLMRGMHHIPVDRRAGAAAYGRAVDALRSGELVGVFPEQTISRSYVPRPMKTGAARMALEADVPLIPVVTWGAQRIWTSGRKATWQRNVPVSVWVDTPLVVAAYPDRRADARDWWLPAHLGGGAQTPEQAAAAELERIHGPAAATPGEQAS